MKPLLSESEDNDALRALGRASVQIVHDLKNQLNGLKLYATFLRKRMEKGERPADELETINKLIAGLDRTARDVSMIVEYGRPLELRKQVGNRSGKTIARSCCELERRKLKQSPPGDGRPVGSSCGRHRDWRPLVGEFDRALLAEALRWISLSAIKMLSNKAGSLTIRLKIDANESRRNGVIEWACMILRITIRFIRLPAAMKYDCRLPPG